MATIESRQHVMLEAVAQMQELKLDKLQRQANTIDSEAQQMLETERELARAVSDQAMGKAKGNGGGRPAGGEEVRIVLGKGKGSLATITRD